MGNRTIKAPGVEIIEHDLSGYTTTNIGTGCLITGFAQKGEDLEPIKITNRSAWLLNFGTPTNEAEEYFYNAGMEVLNQGGFLHAAKIPYSNDMAGIYCAAKYKIDKVRELYRLDDETGRFYKDEPTENGDIDIVNDIEPNDSDGRFIKNYMSMKNLGLNSLQLISPEGQDFLSKDLVEEYETGESTPFADTIYLVDKTRAVYSRAPEIADKQDNRDSRACIGIVPVITTMCNTAWFQKNSTGVESTVDELYQPVRSLRTIEFPAGAASAAEYHPTKFVTTDLHTQLLKDNSVFGTSLSERAATIAQSCLVNGNLVDGKFKPFICNDVCVVVFKAFVSTEDGKIDFDVAETWVGSLDPKGRDEKGRTTFIDTIINNNSEYIYCFSNLANPEQVLNPDHGFVAGSNSDYYLIDTDLSESKDSEYLAASLFSAYAAKMLGFGKEGSIDFGLAAPRSDYTLEATENSLISQSHDTMGALRAFYNQDAKQRICTLDPLVMGYKFPDIKSMNLGKEITDLLSDIDFGGYFSISDKFIAEEPSITYFIQMSNEKLQQDEIKGQIMFNVYEDSDKNTKPYTTENYDYKLTMGRLAEYGEEYQNEYLDHDFDTEKISQLSILNSTDYLRAIYDFDNLVDFTTIGSKKPHLDLDTEDGVAQLRKMAIQSLIINSIEKSGRFIAKLRYLKKAKINLDRLDDAFVDAVSDDTYEVGDNSNAKVVGRKYIEDIYKSYNDTGLLGGIKFIATESKSQASSSSEPSVESGSPRSSLLSKKDELESKLDAIINVDSPKKTKMKARIGVDKQDETHEFEKKYILVRLYLVAQYNAKLADMLNVIAKIMEDCCYAQSRYVESQRNIDDSNIMLGFYPEMAEPIITYTTIAQSLNKILDTMSNVHESDIDVVCDAGISNIAQFVKQVYDPSADDGEDVGGLYEPVKYSAYFKFNKNTDLAYWKTIVYKYDTFCKFRGDCMFCTESPRGMVLIGNKQVVRKTKKNTSVDLNILPYLSKIAGINTSYGAGYLNWYRTISDYTGDTLWVPPSIKAMGTYILTDNQYNWWDAPAGMRRGVINMVETSFNPNKVQAGEIYDTNWNYAIHYLNDGIIQEGQKTFQTRQSALDRVNVRRLLGRIKRYVYFASRQFLYEPHTQAIREKYVKTITPFFQDLVTRGGLYDFKIICDASNNTPEVIDRNELRVKIGIKPVKTIEFIIIDLCVLNTGASWTEMDSV